MTIGGEVCPRCQSLLKNPRQAAYENFQKRQEVVVVDFEMKFFSMVTFMVKWVIAAIPAMIILFFLTLFFLAMLSGLRR